MIASIFISKRKEWGVRVLPEQRVQVSSDRFRIPDVCVTSTETPKEQIIRHPPLLCVEILSPDDRMSRIRERIADFVGMGVPQVWVIDPQTRTALVCDGVTTVEHKTGQLALPGTPIVLDLAEVFAVLDED